MPCAISAALRVAGSAAAVTAALRGELLLIFIHLFIYFLWLAFLTGGFSVLPANSRRVPPLIAASAVSPHASQLGNAALGTKVASKSAVRASDVLLPKRSLKTRPGGAVGLAGWMRRGAGGEPRLGIAAPGPRCLWFLPPSHRGGVSVFLVMQSSAGGWQHSSPSQKPGKQPPGLQKSARAVLRPSLPSPSPSQSSCAGISAPSASPRSSRLL